MFSSVDVSSQPGLSGLSGTHRAECGISDISLVERTDVCRGGIVAMWRDIIINDNNDDDDNDNDNDNDNNDNNIQ
jgi:hypothetical protein